MADGSAAKGRQRIGRIAFGTIVTPWAGTMSQRWDQVRDAHVGGTSVDRYGRTWTLGHPSDDGPYLSGRIGFSRTLGTVPVWNEKRQDFVDRAVLDGQTATYTIQRESLRIAFQFRPPNIKINSFAGAFAALLTEGSQLPGWAVRPDHEGESFPEWRDSVDAITKFTAVFERPNPHFGPRHRVESIITGTKAAIGRLVLEGDDLDLSDDLVIELISHAEHNYGHYSAEGSRGNKSVKFQSEDQGAVAEEKVSLEPGAVEVPAATLRRALRKERPSNADSG